MLDHISERFQKVMQFAKFRMQSLAGIKNLVVVSVAIEVAYWRLAIQSVKESE